jgi:DNA-binding CsgD family transcriptional regulator
MLSERSEHREAEAMLLGAIRQARKSGYTWTLASGVLCLAEVHIHLKQTEQAIGELHEALTLFDQLGEPWGQTTSLLLLTKALARTKPDEALEYGARATAIAVDFDSPLLISEVSIAQGIAWLGKGDVRQATACMCDALVASQTIGVPAAIAEALAWIAVASHTSNPAAAANLLGYADAFQGNDSGPSATSDHEPIASLRLTVRSDPAYASGQTLSEDQAVALGLSLRPAQVNTGISADQLPTDAPPRLVVIENGETLTARELDVLRLLAGGKTNAEIGDALFISPLTAKTHVANLLGKLALENRTAAAAWAAQRGVV